MTHGRNRTRVRHLPSPDAKILNCPQPSGEAVAARDKSDRRQGDTPTSGERLRDVGQAGRSGGQSPTRPPETTLKAAKRIDVSHV